MPVKWSRSQAPLHYLEGLVGGDIVVAGEVVALRGVRLLDVHRQEVHALRILKPDPATREKGSTF